MSKRVNFNLTNNTIGNVGIGTTSPNFTLHVIGDIYATGDILSTSDVRLKTEITPINLSQEKLEKIENLKAVSFKMKNNTNDHLHIGFLAQELEEIVPEVVYTDANTGYKSIAYGNMTALLLEYINQLNGTIKELKEKVEILSKK
jgi:hypothetical protein